MMTIRNRLTSDGCVGNTIKNIIAPCSASASENSNRSELDALLKKLEGTTNG